MRAIRHPCESGGLALGRTTRALCLLVLGLQAYGCAYSNDFVSLTYDPVLQMRQPTGFPIVLYPLRDERPNSRIVGKVRNLNVKHTADILLRDSADPGRWIAEALSLEFGRSGFDARLAASETNPRGAAVVRGVVSDLTIEVSSDFIYRCRLHAHLSVRNPSGDVSLEESFVGKGRSKAKWGTEGELNQAAQSALQDLARKAIPKIAASLGQ